MADTSGNPTRRFLLHRYNPEAEEYSPALDEEMELLRSDSPKGLEFLVNDPASKIDNRTAVRFILALRNVSGEMFRRLTKPYDIGFYKKSDGKSHPLWFLRTPRFLRVFGFKKDIVAVRHDFDYYRGLSGESKRGAGRYHRSERLRADQHYRRAQIDVGLWRIAAGIEFWTLRAAGWWSWGRHRKRSRLIEGYGTIDYVPKLPDKY